MNSLGDEATTGGRPQGGEGSQFIRRTLIAGLFGGALAAGAAAQTQTDTIASQDVIPLELVINVLYVSVNYTQTGFYADTPQGRQLGSGLIQSGDRGAAPGVPAVGARPTPFRVERIRNRIQPPIDHLWNRLTVARDLIRAEAPAQKALDISPQTFTTMLRLAGAIGPTETFDPYANDGNFMVGLFSLIDLYPSMLRGLAPSLNNDIVRNWFGSLMFGAANNSADVRNMLLQMSVARPELIRMADRIAIWQDDIAGLTGSDRRLLVSDGAGTTMPNLSATDANGIYPPRSGQQVLNALFMTRAAVNRGGFFANGINGRINTSAAN